MKQPERVSLVLHVPVGGGVELRVALPPLPEALADPLASALLEAGVRFGKDYAPPAA